MRAYETLESGVKGCYHILFKEARPELYIQQKIETFTETAFSVKGSIFSEKTRRGRGKKTGGYSIRLIERICLQLGKETTQSLKCLGSQSKEILHTAKHLQNTGLDLQYRGETVRVQSYKNSGVNPGNLPCSWGRRGGGDKVKKTGSYSIRCGVMRNPVIETDIESTQKSLEFYTGLSRYESVTLSS